MNASSTFLLNHLLQSTVFAIAAAVFAHALRKNRAEVRFRIWLAASVKFLVPFSWMVSAGQTMKLPPSAIPAAPVIRAAEQLERSFTLSPDPLPSSHTAVALSDILLIVWAIGAMVVLLRWAAAWLRMRRVVVLSSPATMKFPIPVRISSGPVEPGVFGVVRPVLLLPEELTRSFQAMELDAILAHELCHVRRRDNLTAALHAFVQALFWFHPAVWFIGSKLLEERELACDQEVLRAGNRPESYAQGILHVCRLSLEPASACAAGVLGSDLRKRIEAILSGTVSSRLSASRRTVIATFAALAIAGPITFGILQAQQVEGQQPNKPKFEVATVKPSSRNAQGEHFFFQRGGRFSVANSTLKDMISSAYEVRDFQITGGPAWINSDRFDVEAKTGDEAADLDPGKMTLERRAEIQKQRRERVQSLLEDRFHLVVREEQREMPIYALLVTKGGPKLTRADDARQGNKGTRMNRGELEGLAAPPEFLANSLSSVVGRPVVDKTGLQGVYDWKLTWTPDQPEATSPSDISGPSIFTALQDQLGLRLESQKAPARMIVIESASKPTEN